MNLRDVAVILLAWLGAALAHAPILGTPFADESEAREACHVAEVARKGRFLALRVNEEFVPTKPPLLYWWAGSIAAVAGMHEAVLRLSVAATGLIAILATYAIGVKLGGRRTGVWAALFLSTMPFFWVYLTRLRVDMSLVATTTLSLAGFLYAIGGSRGGALVGWTALGLGVLAKGPAAPAAVGIPIALYLAVTRDREGLKRCVSWVGAAICVALVATWLIAARQAYGPTFWTHLLRESASRVVDSSYHAETFNRPFYYYADKLFAQIGVAAVLVLPALAVGWRRPAMRFAWLWLVGLFVFYSVVSYKRDAYLLPLLPAAALLAALAIQEGLARPAALLAALAAIGLAALGSGLVHVNLLPPGHLLLAAAAGLGAGAIAGWQRAGAVGASVLLCAAGALVVYGISMEPRERRYGPAPDAFAAAIQRRVGPGDGICFAPGLRDFALIYYLNRTIPLTGEETTLPAGTFVIARSPPEGAEILESGDGSSGRLVLARIRPAR